MNEIDFDIPASKSRIVVDGWIERGEYPIVVLTRSTSYFTVVDSASFVDFVELRAKVTISNNEKTEVLTLKRNKSKFPQYFYTGSEIIGEIGKTYFLEVKYYDTILTATTTIPRVPPIDTAWFEPKDNADSVGIIRFQFVDNPSEKNYYRVLYKIENEMNEFVPAYISAIEDSYINGNIVKFSLYQGVSNPLDNKRSIYFNRKNTVIIKLSAIDEASYFFWRGYQVEMINSVNPFASISFNMKSNIEGFGFGIWSGADVTFYRFK
jgi:hypothetical protein